MVEKGWISSHKASLQHVVLNHHCAPAFNVCQEPVLIRAEVRPYVIGSHAGHNGVEPAEIAASDVIRAKEVNFAANLPEGFGHFVACTHDIPDGSGQSLYVGSDYRHRGWRKGRLGRKMRIVDGNRAIGYCRVRHQRGNPDLSGRRR
jgi:hypothetical protein